MADALAKAGLTCTGYQPVAKEDRKFGTENATDVGECELENETIELATWKDRGQVENWMGFSKTLGCTMGNALGVSSFDYVAADTWVISNLSQTLANKISEAVGGTPHHIDLTSCPDGQPTGTQSGTVTETQTVTVTPPKPATTGSMRTPSSSPTATSTTGSSPASPNGMAKDGTGSFNFIAPPGWDVQARLSTLDVLQYVDPVIPSSGYGNPIISMGSALLVQGRSPYQRVILLGRLDDSSAESEGNNLRAAQMLASGAGEYLLPFPGTRINQQAGSLPGRSPNLPAEFASYDVQFVDTARPNAQVWAAVVSLAPAGLRAFVLTVGTDRSPIDTVIAKQVARSMTLR